MFNRIELKYKAKQVLNRKLMVMMLMGVFWYFISLSFVQYSIHMETKEVQLLILNYSVLTVSSDEALFFIQKLGLCFVVYTILVLYLFEYGYKNYFKHACRGDEKFSMLFQGFKEGYSKIMATFVIRDLMIFVWSMLLVVPGIMKAYSYRFVPYLVQDHPQMTTGEILRYSAKLTQGYRWQIFILDLSFVGWTLLGIMTMGISSLYSSPYIRLTEAQLYAHLKQRESAYEM